MMMVVVQIVVAGVNIFYKLAANDGMSLRVLVAYRFLFAAAFVLPLALYLDRGPIAQNLYAESLVLTSATFASAMSNLIPAMTFVLAIIFRLERLEFDKVSGKAKVIGTLMGIGGAMLLTFYKGLEIKMWSNTIDLLHNGQHPGRHVSHNHILGALMAVLACFGGSLSLIFQAKMSEKYPCPYSSTALISVIGAIQAVVLALCIEKDWSKWKLGWNIRLLTVAYTGTVASGLMVTFIMTCVRMRGPLFVSVFSPLMLVVVAIAGSLLLDENLHLGSVLGAVVIVCGLYVVLWGKGKEMKRRTQLMPSSCSKDAQQQVHVLDGTTGGASINSSPLAENNKTSSNILAISPNFLPMIGNNIDDVSDEEFSIKSAEKETKEDDEEVGMCRRMDVNAEK
ncbi:hypothetical protein LguiB_006820 [Lonicera macranthoides]